MAGMVERVARAIDPFAWLTEYGSNYRRTDSIRKAKEAIEAMREPTEGMLEAGYAVGPENQTHQIYEDMIDAALKEDE